MPTSGTFMITLRNVIGLFICILLTAGGASQAENRVLWDISHGPTNNYDLDGNYNVLAGILEQAGKAGQGKGTGGAGHPTPPGPD